MKNSEDTFSSIIRHFVTYLGADVISRMIALLLLPVLTFLLTPEEFGILTVFNSLALLMLTLLSLNAYTSIGRYYFEENKDLSSFLSTVLAFSFSVILIIYCFIFALKQQISELVKVPVVLIYYLLPIVVLLSLRSIFSQYCRAKEESKTISRVNVYYSLSYAVLAVVLLLYVKDSTYECVIWANIFVQTMIAIYIFYSLRRYIKVSGVKKQHIRYALGYGFPLIPYTLSTEMLTSFDVLMINRALGAHDAGVYGFAYRIGSLLLMFIIAINSAWTPKYMRYMNEKDYIKHGDFSIKVMTTTLLAAAILICYGDIIAAVVTPEAYDKGMNVISLIVLGYVFYMMFVIYNKHTTYVKRMVFQSLVAVVGGVVNVVANIVCIPRYGIIAAAYTTLGSFVLMAFLSWLVNTCIIKIETVPIKSMLKMLVPIVIVVIIKQLILKYEAGVLWSFLISTTVLVTFIVVVSKGKILPQKGYMS